MSAESQDSNITRFGHRGEVASFCSSGALTALRCETLERIANHREVVDMTARVFNVWMLLLLFAMASTGCVIIPLPGSVDDVSGADRGSQLAVAPGEGVAVVGERGVDDDSGRPDCVREEIEKAAKDMQHDLNIISVSQFQQTLYPWFDPVRRPESIDALEALLRDPEVQDRIASLNLRYLITVSGEEISGELEGPAIPHLLGGVATWHESIELRADVWDLTSGTTAGKVTVDASGDGGFVGYALYGLWLAPLPNGAACRGLGRTLAALIAGAELPEDLQAFLAVDMARKAELEASVEKGDRAAALALVAEFGEAEGLKVLAERGDIEAAKELVKITGESTRALTTSAESGDRLAAILLARYANELEPLRELAESGDYEAARMLAVEFDDSSYLEKRAREGDVVAVTTIARVTGNVELLEAFAEAGDATAASELAEITGNLVPLRSLADRGNAIAAYALYTRLSQDEKMKTDGWKLLCTAANGRHIGAAAKVGFWHQQNSWYHLNQQSRHQLEAIGVRPDNQTAYMWFAVAAANGATPAQLPNKGWGTSVLTADERAQAEQMARDWKPGDCPSEKHRLEQFDRAETGRGEQMVRY
ncbi:MAG: hypothetical protein GTO67_12920 [Gammaproteobacteria bacterium]|nr:hypothetical protein [Gammaproteobacteria bacterium]NIM74882.1 hypothetical protein [Gammaproteobacteria bacterium]NIN39474.1 hypothetical protein [Gammaproteobacteria bacterium]NIO26800.1 hypothetical protein [Gammaproteobacteria bacterium]NIO67356.1 hypothetical protein [Gammaproteobacteria bacterium]